MAFGQTQPVDFNYFLGRKYAIQQQQANAGDVQANAVAQNASTNAVTGAASAALDRTRASLMPAESASTIGLQGAQGGLLREQASVVRPESIARIANMNAETGLTTANTTSVNQINKLYTPSAGGLQSVLGSRGYTGPGLAGGFGADGMFHFSNTPVTGPLPRRQPGETEVQYQDRINGF